MTAVSNDIRAMPGVRSFGSHIGQAFLAEEVVGQNFGEGWFSIDRNADYDKTIEPLGEDVDAYPGIFRELLTYLRERIDEVLAASTEPIVVRIFGEDLKALRHQANSVKEALADVQGPGGAQHRASERRSRGRGEGGARRRPALRAQAGRRAARAARRCSRARRSATSSGGPGHTTSTSGARPKTRRSLTDIRNLPIDTPSGSAGATRRTSPRSASGRRSTSSSARTDERRIDVSAGVAGAQPQRRRGRDVQAKLKQIKFPAGHARRAARERRSRPSTPRTGCCSSAIAAAIGIFLLLQAAFGSLRLATMFFLTLPMALVGGVLAVSLISDGILSLGLVRRVPGGVRDRGAQRDPADQPLPAPRTARRARRSGRRWSCAAREERLSPIMMTALATGLALVPLVVAGSIPGRRSSTRWRS